MTKLFTAILYLFDEGEGGTQAADSTQSATEEQVIYGKQPEQVEEPEVPEAEDKRKQYEDLIKGEFKEFFTEDVQKLFNRRFKETKTIEEKAKALEEKANKQQEVIDLLYTKYKCSDEDSLIAAMNDDDSYWERAAYEAGMTVDQYKEFARLKTVEARAIANDEQRKTQAKVDAQVQQWVAESEGLKEKFPNFDLATEIQEQQFVNYLKAGVPVEHAYKALHMDEIVANAMTTTASLAEKRVVDNVRAKGQRPSENGTSSASAFTYKDDVSKLSREDRAEIAKRVARGEIISF